jgi:hypothetical protein
MAGNSRDDENQKPCISEQYLGAVGSSNLRVGDDASIRTPGDVVAAAGMNRHRLGLALRRLMTQWDSAAKPTAPTQQQIEEIAATLRVEPAELEPGVPNPHAGLVEEFHGARGYTWRLPTVIAEETAARWYANELHLLMLDLSTLPAVRDALVAQEGDVHLVAQVLQWWLDPRCPVCQGRRQRVIAGTGRTGSKNCGTCHGTGTRDLPHGWRGAKLIAHMKASLTAAARDLSEGTFKHQRSHRNEHDRLVQRLRAEGRPVLALPPKIPGRRYSPAGRYHEGEHVTRTGEDVYHVTEMDRDGLCAVFVCVVPPADGSRAVGDADLNLCRRYMRVEYPKKEA